MSPPIRGGRYQNCLHGMERFLLDPSGSVERCEVIGSESVTLLQDDDSVLLVDSALLVTLTTLWAEVRMIEVPSFQVSVQRVSMAMLINILSTTRRKGVLGIHQLRCVCLCFDSVGAVFLSRNDYGTGRFYRRTWSTSKAEGYGTAADVVHYSQLLTTVYITTVAIPCCTTHSMLRVVYRLICIYSWSAQMCCLYVRRAAVLRVYLCAVSISCCDARRTLNLTGILYLFDFPIPDYG